jgi:hypothetical protein
LAVAILGEGEGIEELSWAAIVDLLDQELQRISLLI